MRLFRKPKQTIDFDEILLDASNLPDFNQGRLEGRLEIPVSRRGVFAVGIVFVVVASVFIGRLFQLQILEGRAYAERSINNHIETSVIFAERGVIYDRNGERLAWNAEGSTPRDFAERTYTTRRGLGQVLGYVNYPRKDKAGFYFRTDYVGRGGVEEAYEGMLQGSNGEQLVEVDAHGDPVAAHVVHEPTSGGSVTLTIDAALTEAFYEHIATSAAKVGFRSGAGAIMDIHTGEILTLVSYPSFDPQEMLRGDQDVLAAYNADERLPFLNKIISGLYTPGSIIKPFVALAALEEKIIRPEKEIVSTGSLVVPNPYNPSRPSIFTDWRAHGAVDMRHAIAVSSNVYFYVVGGGFGDQKGLGITRLHEYMSRFGFEQKTGIRLGGEVSGIVPDPSWKKDVFDEEWLLGDTYNTSIGQFGFQVTPLEVLRAYAAVANGGTLLMPTLIAGSAPQGTDIGISQESLKVVREGMRLGAKEGTARALSATGIEFAGKTGTAELDAQKRFVNSWVAGYYPYENPRYAFVLLMEPGSRENLFGAAPIMSQFFTWMQSHAPEYVKDEDVERD